MRAAATLRMLAGWAGQARLVVIPVYGNGTRVPDPDIAALCASWELVEDPGGPRRRTSALAWLADWTRHGLPPEWRRCHSAWQRLVAGACREGDPELVIVFRFYLWPFLDGCLGQMGRVWLDLDEMESASRLRQAGLFALNGGARQSRRLRTEAAAYARLESLHFPRFERIFLSSGLEAAKARRAHPGCRIEVLANTYPFDRPCPGRASGETFRLLFVGSFGYYPNRDAFDYFRSSILPILRAGADRPVEFHIAGSGPAFVRSPDPGIILHGFVEDLAPLYESCDLAVVPLRSGAGTRIKILEAFSHRRAVVSTVIGMEGLEAGPGTDLLVADTPEAFAAACLRLLRDETERNRVAGNGYSHYRRWHSPEVLAAAIRSM